MTGIIPARAGKLAAALLAVSAVLAVAAGAASAGEVIYNTIPSPLPGNFASIGFEATQTSEFGGQVEFAGTARKNPKVYVTMSSWGCEMGTWFEKNCKTSMGGKFAWPITLNIYEVGAENSVGAKIASATQTFSMPYRPSASTKCTGKFAGEWFHKGSCFNGKAFKIKFGLALAKLPSKAIVSVAYNTSDYGAEKQRPKPCDSTAAGCPYDSLNVAILEAGEPGPSVGSDPAPKDAYINSTTAANYCENEPGVNTFAISKGCWTNEQPVFEVKAH
jgi:hypothetical protein